MIDAKTCAITLYAVNMNEPITAAWNAIYPGLLTPLSNMSTYLRSHLRYPEDLFNDQAQAYAQVHITSPTVFYNGSDLFNIAQESVNGTNQATTAYYVEATLPGTSSPQFVLLQTFSPGASGGGTTANNMTAWLAAECDYTGTNEPKLVSVRLNNADNVLGPLQFENNINTNPTISSEITLLSQHGSTVTLGNIIILPFNNDSFLYVRPLYLTAAANGGTAFPQLQEVIVGDQNAVQQGTSFSAAVSNLINNGLPVPGLPTTGTTTGPTPSPSTVAHHVAEPGHHADAHHHADRHHPGADHRPGQQDRRRQRGCGNRPHGRQLHRVRCRRGQGAGGPDGAAEAARPAVVGQPVTVAGGGRKR